MTEREAWKRLLELAHAEFADRAASIQEGSEEPMAVPAWACLVAFIATSRQESAGTNLPEPALERA